MKRFSTLIFSVLLISVIIIILAGFIKNTGPDFTEDIFQKTKTNYFEYCAGCHGYQLQEFINKSKWLYGTSEEDLFRNIKYGQEEIGMPAFMVTFSDEEIRNLTAYILSDGMQDKFMGRTTPAHDEYIINSEKQKFKIDTIVSGLDIPWGMTWLPEEICLLQNGRVYYTDFQTTSCTLYRAFQKYMPSDRVGCSILNYIPVMKKTGGFIFHIRTIKVKHLKMAEVQL